MTNWESELAEVDLEFNVYATKNRDLIDSYEAEKDFAFAQYSDDPIALLERHREIDMRPNYKKLVRTMQEFRARMEVAKAGMLSQQLKPPEDPSWYVHLDDAHPNNPHHAKTKFKSFVSLEPDLPKRRRGIVVNIPGAK